MLIFIFNSYSNPSLAGSSTMLNSATGLPRSTTRGANIAAGYTTDEVPTTKHKSQDSTKVPRNKSYNSTSPLKCHHILYLRVLFKI